MLGLHESEWIAEAEDLQSETLVFLIRYIRKGGQEVYGRLVRELSRRIAHLVNGFTQNLDNEAAAEDIAMKVEDHIMGLVLTEEATRQSDYLEVAFTKAVKRRAIDAVRRYKTSWMGAHRGEVVPNGGDMDLDEFEEVERPIEFARDPGVSPETIVLIVLGAAMGSFDVKSRFNEIKVPVLYILSRTDKLFPPTLAPPVMQAMREAVGVQ